MRCRNPDCSRYAMPGDKWCFEHGAMLRRIRAELEATSIWSAAKKGNALRCPVLGCTDYRLRGEVFCQDHQDQGYVPEAA